MASRKFSDLTPVQQAAIVTLLPAAVALVVFYDLVTPVHQQVATLRAQLQILGVQNLRGHVLEAHRAELFKHLAQAQEQLRKLRGIVPDQAADDDLMRTIYGSAVLSDVHIRSLMAGKPEQMEYFTTMPFELHVDGTYYRLLDFFARLAGSSRIVDVSGLLLEQPPAGGARGTYKVSKQETVAADCILTTYFRNPQAPSSSVPGSGPK